MQTVNHACLLSFQSFLLGNVRGVALPHTCCHPCLHSCAALACRPASGRGCPVALCLGHGRRAVCGYTHAVFSFLLLPTHSQGIPGKTVRVKIMATCQRDLSFKSQETLAPTGLNYVQWDTCPVGGSVMPPAPGPPTLLCRPWHQLCCQVLPLVEWKKGGHSISKGDSQKQSNAGWRKGGLAPGVCFLRNKDNFPHSPSNTPLLYMSHQPEIGSMPPKPISGKRMGLNHLVWLSQDSNLDLGEGPHLCVTLEWGGLTLGFGSKK